METLGIEVFIIAGVLGGITAYFANGRGRDPTAWFFLGFFFGIFALIALFVLKPLNVEEAPSKPKDEAPPASPQTEECRQKEWFYLDGERTQLGPIPFDNIEELFRAGTLTSRSFLWREGMEKWRRIEDLPEVNALLTG